MIEYRKRGIELGFVWNRGAAACFKGSWKIPRHGDTRIRRLMIDDNMTRTEELGTTRKRLWGMGWPHIERAYRP